MNSKLLIGWAEESIMPDKKVKLAGQFYERISEYVETPITATAMAVMAGEEQMIICSCVLVWVGENLVRLVRDRLKGKVAGLDVNKVIFNATHTHTAMAYTDSETEAVCTSLNILKRYLPKDKLYTEKISSPAGGGFACRRRRRRGEVTTAPMCRAALRDTRAGTRLYEKRWKK